MNHIIKIGDKSYTLKEYLLLVIGDKSLVECILSDKETPIIIKGRQGATGKSTLEKILTELGYTVVQEVLSRSVTLDEFIEKMEKIELIKKN